MNQFLDELDHLCDPEPAPDLTDLDAVRVTLTLRGYDAIDGGDL